MIVRFKQISVTEILSSQQEEQKEEEEEEKQVAEKRGASFAAMLVTVLVRMSLCVSLVFFLLFPAGASASQPIIVMVNRQPLVMDVPPHVQGGRTLVPLRAIFEALGATVEWDASTRSVIGSRSGRTVVLQVNNKVAWVDGSPVAVEAPPTVFGGRIMVPTRFIAESLGAKVSWDGQNRTVVVETVDAIRETTVYGGPERRLLSMREVVVIVRPALVRVETQRGHGSGFFVSSDGLVLTNAHVARGSLSITVTTQTGDRFPAQMVKINNHADLALLKVAAPPGRAFPIIKHKAYSDRVQTGEEVLAFGSPLGLADTVTNGIISTQRDIDLTFGAWASAVRTIQHNAAIAPGSSGGPLVNLYGDLIGVNTLVVREWAGFGFAVPADNYYWLKKQEDYSLKDDWFSYYSEAYLWHEENNKIVRVQNEAMAAPWGTGKADLLSQYLFNLRALRNEVASYQPTYAEIQRLHQLYLAKLDASNAYNIFILDAVINRIPWSQDTDNRLINSYRQASDAYWAEWRRIEALFR